MASKLIVDQIEGMTNSDLVQIPTGVHGEYFQQLFGIGNLFAPPIYTNSIITASPWMDARVGGGDFTLGSIEAALALLSSGGTLYIPGPTLWTITDDLTIPSNVNLRFAAGARFSIDGGCTVTINGGIEAGPWQIFEGSGTVAYSSAINSWVWGKWTGSSGITISNLVTFDTFPLVTEGLYPTDQWHLVPRKYIDEIAVPSDRFSMAILQDRKKSGTVSQSFPVGNQAYVRELNYIHSDINKIVSDFPGTGYFSLRAGTYYIDIEVQTDKVGRNMVYLWSEVREYELQGKSETSDGGDGTAEVGHARCQGVITIASETQFCVKHFVRAGVSTASAGGRPTGRGFDEIYASVIIMKLGV